MDRVTFGFAFWIFAQYRIFNVVASTNSAAIFVLLPPNAVVLGITMHQLHQVNFVPKSNFAQFWVRITFFCFSGLGFDFWRVSCLYGFRDGATLCVFLAVSLLPFWWFSRQSYGDHSAHGLRFELVCVSPRATKIFDCNYDTITAICLLSWSGYRSMHIGHLWNGSFLRIQRLITNILYALAYVCLYLQLVRSSISYYLAFELISNR